MYNFSFVSNKGPARSSPFSLQNTQPRYHGTTATAEGDSYTSAPTRGPQKCNSSPVHSGLLLLCFLAVLFEFSIEDKVEQPCALCRALSVPRASEEQPGSLAASTPLAPFRSASSSRWSLASLSSLLPIFFLSLFTFDARFLSTQKYIYIYIFFFWGGEEVDD